MNFPSQMQSSIATMPTLAEQVGITEAEIAERKALLGFGVEHVIALASVRPLVELHLEDLVGTFYSGQLENPSIRNRIGDSDTLGRLTSAMRRYIVDLFSGIYDVTYAGSRLRIGKVHARIGVPPKLYVSSLHSLEEHLIALMQSIPEIPNSVQALHKLLALDLQLVFDTYIQGLVAEAESAKAELSLQTAKLERTVIARTAELRLLGETDEVTGLMNRKGFFAAVERILIEAKISLIPVSALFIDIDNFKKLNDTRGHIYGDQILTKIGLAMRSVLHNGQYACRFGGDEFCIALLGANEGRADEIANNLRAIVESTFDSEVSISIGVANFTPNELPTAERLIAEADSRMYEVKRGVPQSTRFRKDEGDLQFLSIAHNDARSQTVNSSGPGAQ